MKNNKNLDKQFDDFLFQIINWDIPYEDYEKGRRVKMFERVKEWKSKYGYVFSIYSNDHLIDGKPHFHLDNIADKVSCKLWFDGEIIECAGKRTIPSRILKELKYFLKSTDVQNLIKRLWNQKNPELTVI